MRSMAISRAVAAILATCVPLWLSGCGGAGPSSGPGSDLYGVNLLRNPSAEEGGSSDQHPTATGSPGLVEVPGWETPTRYGGLGCVREYAVTGGTGLGGGAKYFAFGGWGLTYNQRVDLSPLAADIDAGLVECTLSATIGVRDTSGGTVELLAYVDEYSPRRCGAVIGPDHGIHTTAGVLAKGEHFVRVAFGFWEYNGGVDDLSLVLTRRAGG